MVARPKRVQYSAGFRFGLVVSGQFCLCAKVWTNFGQRNKIEASLTAFVYLLSRSCWPRRRRRWWYRLYSITISEIDRGLTPPICFDQLFQEMWWQYKERRSSGSWFVSGITFHSSQTLRTSAEVRTEQLIKFLLEQCSLIVKTRAKEIFS